MSFSGGSFFISMTLKSFILYGIFGVLSTVIDIFTYWFVSRVFSLPVVISTVIAWLFAVLFAYCTNRKYVFESQVHSFSGIIREALYFFAARIATGLLDVAIMFVFADILAFNDVYVKTASNILVIILNFIASKIFIFRREKES